MQQTVCGLQSLKCLLSDPLQKVLQSLPDFQCPGPEWLACDRQQLARGERL